MCDHDEELTLLQLLLCYLKYCSFMASRQAFLRIRVGDPDTMWFHGLMRPKMSLYYVYTKHSTSADLHQPQHEVFFPSSGYGGDDET